MANTVYPIGKKAILDGDIDFLTDTIKIVLCDVTVTYNAAHDFLSDIAAGDRVATSAALSSKTTTGGAFDAADVTFTSLTGSEVKSWILYKDSGSEATSALIAFFDTVSGGGALSFTPNGGNFTLVFGASGIFTI
jgi:hypothetical protein